MILAAVRLLAGLIAVGIVVLESAGVG